MQKSFVTIILAAILGVTAGCSRTDTATSSSQTLLYTPRYAHGFSLTGDSTAVTLNVFNPWQGADSVTISQTFSRAATRIIAMSTTHVALLDAIGATDCIVGVSGKRYINNPHIANNSNIVEVGYEGSTIDYEAIAASGADLVLLYGVNGASSMEQKLRELGIPYMYIGDYLEQHPLGKAEWMVALGAVTGHLNHARQVFAREDSLYTALRNSSQADGTERPRVMLNAPYAGNWLLPPRNSYILQLIDDAGGQPVFNPAEGSSSQAVSFEEAYVMLDKADLWLNVNNYTTMAELLDANPKLASSRPVTDKHVYNNNGRLNAAGGNDYYESAVARPSEILREMRYILHPGNDSMQEHLRYYRHLE